MMDNTNLNSTTLEIKIDKKIAKRFKYALECSQATAKVEVYKILLHFVKNSNKQSLKDVIEHLNETIRNKGSIDQYEELDTLLNFQDNEGNTLLHYAALHNKPNDIPTLMQCGANCLIKNTDGKTPLDFAQGDTKTKLIESMKDQAQLKEGSSIYDALGRTFAVSLLAFIAFGLCACIAAECDVVSFPSAILGAIIASPLVGIAAGLIIYFLDHDCKQAGAISTLLQEFEMSEKTPLLQPSV
ncbi:ankyrin repeat domain-containing protein [Wolbachia endosymbiont (group B) of Erebia ligea]|uniref:ankyrin repeat domain-containing protein n=1 Tax=Wolbachia endosymbiont (group B) of Erebia ligea TaxID=2954010 RepID=UPI0021F870B2|nr:ankyrin repeat domain-containing protein [Wolbachia endosymbiont (group B) of Erebia ligea]